MLDRMGRPPRFSAEAILSAAARLAADEGPAGSTIAAIAESLGAPTGSIYHRFASRDVLLGELWLQTVEGFQVGFQAALAGPHPLDAGLAAALYTPDWARAHPIPARLLLLHRREDFLPKGWPPEISERAGELNKRTGVALRSFTRRALRSTSAAALRRSHYAVVDLPYAAVIPHLRAAEPPPRIVDELITAAYQSVMPAPS
jgi:AcrR family transcriptional regulator